MRFQPGTFLEVDDLAGGRKVVMVCKDGVTFWDMLDAKEATPLVIHPSMNPVEIGTFAQFSAAKGLQRATRKVIAFLRRRLDTRLDSDPLRDAGALVRRTEGAGDAYEPDDGILDWACEQAQSQQQAAARIHGYAEKFCVA
ncbi:hypothetical protein C0073_021840 (plasmid) [Aeromonas veronii]|nr:hypothetical protein C0073_021840 [Aeromonas veronii]